MFKEILSSTKKGFCHLHKCLKFGHPMLGDVLKREGIYKKISSPIITLNNICYPFTGPMGCFQGVLCALDWPTLSLCNLKSVICLSSKTVSFQVFFLFNLHVAKWPNHLTNRQYEVMVMVLVVISVADMVIVTVMVLI